MELLDRNRLRAQLQCDGVRRLVVEGLPVVRVDGTAEVGVLAEPVGVVLAVRLDVRLNVVAPPPLEESLLRFLTKTCSRESSFRSSSRVWKSIVIVATTGPAW